MTTTSPATTSATAVQTRERPWWMILIAGILALVVGALLLWGNLVTQLRTYLLLVEVLGLWWLISGIMDIVHMFTDHTAWGWKLFMGIVSILAGGWILMYPVVAATTLPSIFVLVLGIWGFVHGIVLLFLAFRGGGWGAGILGVISIIFGLILMANYMLPGWGLSLIWVAAVFGVVGGIVLIFQAFRVRRA